MCVYKSPYPDIDIPRLDILSLLFDSDWCLAKENQEIHVEAANPANSITKSAASDLTKRVAYILRHHFGVGSSGIGRDVVLTVLHGGPFAPVFFYGVVAAGGIFCGANPDYQMTELTRQINDSQATVLVCSPRCEALVVRAAKQCGIDKGRVLVLDSDIPSSWKLISANDHSDLLQASCGKTHQWQRITDLHTIQQTTVCLLYSSGTTGLPKGVRLSHWGLVANNVCTMAVARRYKTDQGKQGRPFSLSTIAHLPMANIAGITLYSTNPFYMGGTTWWMDKFDFDDFLTYHRRYKPQYQFSVPPIWLRIAKSDKVTDHFDNLRVAVTGSAPMGQELLRELSQKLGRGRAEIAQTWGTTETSGVITATDWPTFAKTGSWTVGELCPNVTLRVVDDDFRDVANGTAGELLVGGPIIAQGYFKNLDADRSTFVGGYYCTGDIGIYKDGHVQIIDRKKELIKYKGSQVAPAELEGLLVTHPQIADAAVIGIWNEDQQTEIPCGYVVVREGRSVSAQEVLEFVKQRVANYKQLRGGVEFLDEIPKSASGKILRKELRALKKAAKPHVAKL